MVSTLQGMTLTVVAVTGVGYSNTCVIFLEAETLGE